jgi:FkbH-like protein
VWGEDPFALRRLLLNDPRLQLPSLTQEAAARSDLVKAQLKRQNLRTEIIDEAAYIASLGIQCTIEKVAPLSDRLARIEELFQRTTQFNTTGRKFSQTELTALVANPNAMLFAMDVADKFGAHGLVGSAVIAGGEILGFAISCRVLGMGVEQKFMRHILDTLKNSASLLTARIVPTQRNIPVRNIYRDNGFTESEPGVWQYRF